MKILMVGIQWPPETFIKRLILGLSAAGNKITVVSRQKPEGVEWVHPQFLNFVNVKNWDVLYFPWNSAAIENMKLLESGVTSVLSCRGSQINVAPHNPRRAAIVEGLKNSFKKVSAVHCVSKNIKEEAVKLGLDDSKAEVIYSGIETGFFTPAARSSPGQTLRLVTTGGLSWIKGQEYLLTALRGLKDKGLSFHLDMIGDGTERQRVLYTLDDLGLKNEVTLNGKLSPDKVREKLQSSDIFVFSSLSEGLSNAVLEAMSCGLPVVTTDCGGMREAVTHEKEGLVVPVRDPANLAEAVLKLAADGALRKKMGSAGRSAVEEKFELKKQTELFIKLLNRAKEAHSCAV